MKFDLILVGFILLFVALVLIISSAKESKWAIGGFIGPIPFGFASESKLLWLVWLLLGLSLLLFLLAR